MPILNFKKQFQAALLNGKKSQTIRAMRKIPIKAGDSLHLYTGLRTKNVKKLGEVTCNEVSEIALNLKNFELNEFFINKNKISATELEKIALADGFKSLYEFWKFFQENHNNPYFLGQLIKW